MEKVIREYSVPYPPTVNTYWRRVGSRTYVSNEGKRYRKIVRAVLREQAPVLLTGKLKIDIVANVPDRRRRDLDNILKALLDSLAGHVYEDDSQIVDLRIARGEVIKGGSIVFWVEPIQE